MRAFGGIHSGLIAFAALLLMVLCFVSLVAIRQASTLSVKYLSVIEGELQHKATISVLHIEIKS